LGLGLGVDLGGLRRVLLEQTDFPAMRICLADIQY
jgi:hypothetical protein